VIFANQQNNLALGGFDCWSVHKIRKGHEMHTAAVLTHLKKHGQLPGSEIPVATGIPIPDVRAAVFALPARGEVSLCDVTKFDDGLAVLVASQGGCALAAVADAAVTVGAVPVKSAAKVAGAAVDVATYPFKTSESTGKEEK
jgi:hypothetical protein